MSFRSPTARWKLTVFHRQYGQWRRRRVVAIAPSRAGQVAMAGPMGGPAGEDATNGDASKSCAGKSPARQKRRRAFLPAHPGSSATALPQAILINPQGDRTIVTYRDERVATVQPADPEGLAAAADLVLADNRYPEFSRPIGEAALPPPCRSCSTATASIGRGSICSCSPTAKPHLLPPNVCAQRPAATIWSRDCNASHSTPTHSSPSATGRATSFSSPAGRCAACPCSRLPRSIRSAPAMPCTAASRSRSPKDAVEVEVQAWRDAACGDSAQPGHGGLPAYPTRAEVEAFLSKSDPGSARSP